MAVDADHPGKITESGSLFLMEHRFESARLNRNDLHHIAKVLGSASQSWFCMTAKALPAGRNAKRVALTEWTASSFEEFERVAPAGRIFYFRFDAEVGHSRIWIHVGDRRSRKIFATAGASRPAGREWAPEYDSIVQVMSASARRGTVGRLTYAALATLVFLALLAWWGAIYDFVRTTPSPAGKVLNSPGAAIAATFFTLVALGVAMPLLGGLTRLAASSVKVKAGTLNRNARSLGGRAWRGLRSFFPREESQERKTYAIAKASWIVGVLGFVVALLAWLFPRK